MDPGTIAVLSLCLFLALVLLEVPVGLALITGGIVGVIMLDGAETASILLGSIPYSSTASYSLFVIPLYVLLGALVANAGLGTRIYRVVYRVVRRVPGGLAATTVIATAFFSGISGSSAADVATFGKISVREMERHGYRREYAAAVVAAAGTFAGLIPPSIVLVLYAIIAGESVGALILAGLIPGVFSASILVGFVVLRAMRWPEKDFLPSSPLESIPDQKIADRRGLRGDLIGFFYGVLLSLIVVGGLFGGYFTATEAAAVGSFVALLITIGIALRDRDLTIRGVLSASLRDAVSVTSMIFLLVIGGAILTYLFAASAIPQSIASWILDLPVPPLVVVALFLLLMLPLGTVLEGLSILLLTVPLAVPVVSALGYETVWFGIMTIKMIEIGLITPPVGINGFVISGVVNVPAARVFRRLGVFVALDLLVACILFAFPEITLWLPRAAGLL